MAQKLRSHQIAVRLSEFEQREIQSLLESGLYRSGGDFAREVIREKLRRTEIVSIGEESPKKVEGLTLQYLERKNGPNYASEIAEELGLEYSGVFKVVNKLLDEGVIRRSKV